MSERVPVPNNSDVPLPPLGLDPNIFRNVEVIPMEKVGPAVKKILDIFLNACPTDGQIIQSIHAILGPNPGNAFVREIMIRMADERNQNLASTHHIGRALRLVHFATGVALKKSDTIIHADSRTPTPDMHEYLLETFQFDILAAIQEISETPVSPAVLNRIKIGNREGKFYTHLASGAIHGGTWAWQDDFLGLYKLTGSPPPPAVVYSIFRDVQIERIFQVYELLLKTRIDPTSLQAVLDLRIAKYLATPSLYSQRLALLNSLDHQTAILSDIPWGTMYQRLEKVHPPSPNAEYNPWSTDFDPLIKHACTEKLLDPENKKDADIVFDFVQTYGMYNIPTVLRWHVALSRTRSIADLPEDIKDDIEKTLHVKIADLQQKGDITRAIERFRLHLQSELLADRIPPEVFSTELGLDFFLSLKGVTEWETDDHPRDILQKLATTRKRKPKASRLQPGYKELTINVPTTERRPAEETREIDSAQSELLKDPNIDVVLDEFWDAHRLLNEDHSYPRNITPYLSGLLLEIEKGIKLSTNNVEIKNLTKTERWIQNYLADIEKTLMLGDDYFIERTLVAMNEILSLPPTTFRDRMLRAMSALHGSIGMPQPIRAMIAKHSQDYTNPEKRRSLVMFTAEYMRNALFEFIFSANLWQVSARPDAELMDLWRQGITAPSQNPLIEIAKKIAQLERQKYRPTATGRDISLVPVKGPLLAYAGDIGDACYTRLHKDIAQGAYPNMTGYIFVENRGTQKETMRGSCLMIEAKTDEGKPILLMRGNNPRKNLLRQFDAWTFVKQTLISFDRIRKERDAVALGIPWDKAGTSSSNREEVSDVYQKIVRWMKRRNRGVAVTLKQSPETEFNDYNNWDPERGHPVILLTADDISELAKLETLGDS